MAAIKLAIDASVSAKWYVEEDYSDLADLLLGSRFTLIAPQLLVPELTNVLRKKVERSQVSMAVALTGIRALPTIPVELFDSRSLAEPAFELAIRLKLSGYAATYAALAIREGCQLVTADRRLFEAIEAAYPGSGLWIADVPA